MNVLNCVINPRWGDQSIWKGEQDRRKGKQRARVFRQIKALVS
jgi:hypothetical protein